MDPLRLAARVAWLVALGGTLLLALGIAQDDLIRQMLGHMIATGAALFGACFSLATRRSVHGSHALGAMAGVFGLSALVAFVMMRRAALTSWFGGIEWAFSFYVPAALCAFLAFGALLAGAFARRAH